jgi:hypothetical protein
MERSCRALWRVCSKGQLSRKKSSIPFGCGCTSSSSHVCLACFGCVSSLTLSVSPFRSSLYAAAFADSSFRAWMCMELSQPDRVAALELEALKLMGEMKKRCEEELLERARSIVREKVERNSMARIPRPLFPTLVQGTPSATPVHPHPLLVLPLSSPTRVAPLTSSSASLWNTNPSPNSLQPRVSSPSPTTLHRRILLPMSLPNRLVAADAKELRSSPSTPMTATAINSSVIPIHPVPPPLHPVSQHVDPQE